MAAEERAEQLKLRGNQCFQKGKLLAAIDMYTEAIVLCPTITTYYSNRALCYSKLENWAACRDDCERALAKDPLNAKASYLLGTSLTRLLVFDAAIEALQQALASAQKTRKSAAFQNEITLELRRVKKQRWMHEQKRRVARHDKVRVQLAQLLGSRRVAEVFEASVGAESGQRQAAEELDAMVAYVEHLFASAEDRMHPGEVPEYFVCPVSMEIMHDPVTTPNGVSYERSCLEKHIRTNGPIDPLTRKRLTLDMIRPNTSLREAIQDFLDKNAWAFEY